MEGNDTYKIRQQWAVLGYRSPSFSGADFGKCRDPRRRYLGARRPQDQQIGRYFRLLRRR